MYALPTILYSHSKLTAKKKNRASALSNWLHSTRILPEGDQYPGEHTEEYEPAGREYYKRRHGPTERHPYKDPPYEPSASTAYESFDSDMDHKAVVTKYCYMEKAETEEMTEQTIGVL